MVPGGELALRICAIISVFCCYNLHQENMFSRWCEVPIHRLAPMTKVGGRAAWPVECAARLTMINFAAQYITGLCHFPAFVLHCFICVQQHVLGDSTMRTNLLILLAILAMWTLPCLAEWGQAESADFALDTTVPEPALIAAAILPLWLIWRRK